MEVKLCNITGKKAYLKREGKNIMQIVQLMRKIEKKLIKIHKNKKSCVIIQKSGELYERVLRRVPGTDAL